MFEIQSSRNTAKVFTDHADEACISQIFNLLRSPAIQGERVRIMPDCHAGKDCVIGYTQTISDAVIPSLVGSDIGCGMLTIQLQESEIDFARLDEVIHLYVPSGSALHEKPVHSLK